MNQEQHAVPPAPGRRHRLPRHTLATLLLGLAMTVSPLPAAASHAASTHSSAVTTQLEAYLGGLAAQGKFSGAVLVARHGTIMLSKGYGMADRALHIPNTSDTRYPVGGVSSSMSLIGALWLEDHGKLPDQAPVCSYLSNCPATWEPITVHMLLDGTANIPSFDWEHHTGTTAHSLQLLEAQPLDGQPGSRSDFQNGDTLVLATIIEKVTGEPWATFLHNTIFGPAGMPRSGRMTNTSTPPEWAQDYSGQSADGNHIYDVFFAVSSTAADVYAYDNALFGGRLLAPSTLARMLTPRAALSAGSSAYLPWLTDLRSCYQAWTSGRAFGHPVLYTISGARSFQTINMRFPQDGATIIVISNDDYNDIVGIARHLAALAFGTAKAFSQAVAAPIMPARVVSPAKAVLATYGYAFGGWPFALTPGALWFPTTSANGDLGTVTRVDTRTGRVVATITVSKLPNDQGQDSVVVADGQLWAIDHEAEAVVRIDPATNKVVATVPIGMRADQLAIAGTTLWASSGDPSFVADKVVRVDLRTQKVVAVITHVGHPFLDTAATPDAFWYISQDSLRVMRIDAATNKIVAAISAGPVPQTILVGAGSIWVGDASGALVTRIDPGTNKVIASISTDGYPGTRQPHQDDCACQYAVGDGAVWVLANNTTLLRIDPRTNHPVASLTFDDDLYAVGLSEGSVWVAGGGQNNVNIYRVNPQAMQ